MQALGQSRPATVQPPLENFRHSYRAAPSKRQRRLTHSYRSRKCDKLVEF